MNEATVRALAARDITADFERCRGFLVDALEYAGGTCTIEDIVAGVARGAYHFWPGSRSALITEVAEYPRARFLNVFLAGGDLEEIKAMQPHLTSWAAYLGCSKVVIMGRPGWERALKPQGWHKELVMLTLPVEASSNGEE